MEDLLKTHQLNKILVGMEPTGHYWFNLARWLSDQGLAAVLVNPDLVKKNKEN
ncbi:MULTISPECIES: IS110 family transposase [Paenibacillus]|uniref:IS110 family transposase n=1 Tax=Paenibacillus TaxID=44249 RepID=UPI0028AB1ACF|nr:transposase [Paenibacillus xylanilyticus]